MEAGKPLKKRECFSRNLIKANWNMGSSKIKRKNEIIEIRGIRSYVKIFKERKTEKYIENTW